MSGIVWSELFPTKISIFIFLGYMSLFISQGKNNLNYTIFDWFAESINIFPGILVTQSQESNNGYSYNTVTVVLMTEILKLIVSASLYCRT